MKKILAIVMAVCMIASLGITAHADAADYPWGSLDVSRVVFADGTASVAAAPFAGMTSVAEVVLPASVAKVEADAFADAAVASVATAGDPAVVADVAAFANAEVSEISADDFAAIVDEIEAAATMKQDTFSYDAASKSLLVKGTAPKAPVVPFNYAPSGDVSYDYESAPGSSNVKTYVSDIIDADGNVIGQATVTETYNEDGTIQSRHADLAFDDGTSATVDESFTYDENGKETGSTYEFSDSDGFSAKETTENTSDTTRTVTTDITYPDGTTSHSERNEVLDDTGAWVPVADSSGESELNG